MRNQNCKEKSQEGTMSDKLEITSDLITIREAALILRLQVSTLRAWILHRSVPFVKLGGKRVFFRRADLEALIRESVVPAKIKEDSRKAA
jgi:excisionase family DNA binding protein